MRFVLNLPSTTVPRIYNIRNVNNVVNCVRCKWFTGLVYEDIDIVFGLCKATEDDIIMTEDDAFEDLPCDLYADLCDGNAAEGDQ